VREVPDDAISEEAGRDRRAEAADDASEPQDGVDEVVVHDRLY
jgi:hypothetical protein